MGVGRVSDKLTVVPTVEWGFSNAIGPKPLRFGGYIKGVSSVKNPQEDAFVSFGLNMRKNLSSEARRTLNVQFGPGIYLSNNATSIFGNRLGLYGKLSYHHHFPLK